jgi:hypothetical protein
MYVNPLLAQHGQTNARQASSIPGAAPSPAFRGFGTSCILSTLLTHIDRFVNDSRAHSRNHPARLEGIRLSEYFRSPSAQLFAVSHCDERICSHREAALVYSSRRQLRSSFCSNISSIQHLSPLFDALILKCLKLHPAAHL